MLSCPLEKKSVTLILIFLIVSLIEDTYSISNIAGLVNSDIFKQQELLAWFLHISCSRMWGSRQL